ncbi:MAG: hypothetical protein QMD94_03650, partial [Candidatus Omnitrophota bacterium]|nr:hypothetical protein [Candidatus Omnitrophota bacterium]
CFLAVYSIARKLKLNKELSYFCAALFILIPNFFKQLQIAYVDVMVAGLFLSGVNFLFLLKESFTLSNVLMYSLSMGLLIGVKTIALPYSIVLFLPFVYLCFIHSPPLFKAQGRSFISYRRACLFILAAAIIIFLGGFSYIRNFFQTGNPLYPLNFKIFGAKIFKGVMDMSIYRAHFRIEDYKISKLLFHEGLGLQTLLFVLPGVFLGLPAAIIKRKGNSHARQDDPSLALAYFLIIPIFIYLIYRYVIPLPNSRYLYSLLGIGMVIGFYAYDSLKVPKKNIRILIALCVFGSMFELAKKQELLVSAVLTFLLFLILLFFREIIDNFVDSSARPLDCVTLMRHSRESGNPRRRILDPRLKHSGMTKACRRDHFYVTQSACGLARNDTGGVGRRIACLRSAVVILFIIVIILAALFGFRQDYIKNEYPRYAKMVKYSHFWPEAIAAWIWVNENTTGNNIAYIGRPVPFPLYGTNFKNNVYYVSVNEIDPVKLHSFPDGYYKWGMGFLSVHESFQKEHNYRSRADYSLWIRNLLRRKTDYLFVYSLHQAERTEFPIEDAWAKENPSRFRLVFSNEAVHIYQVKQ